MAWKLFCVSTSKKTNYHVNLILSNGNSMPTTLVFAKNKRDSCMGKILTLDQCSRFHGNDHYVTTLFWSYLKHRTTVLFLWFGTDMETWKRLFHFRLKTISFSWFLKSGRLWNSTSLYSRWAVNTCRFHYTCIEQM